MPCVRVDGRRIDPDDDDDDDDDELNYEGEVGIMTDQHTEHDEEDEPVAFASLQRLRKRVFGSSAG